MIVILDNLRSALNVGSIIRTCDALGIKEMYICGITADPASNKKVAKTSLGAESNIKFKYAKETRVAVEDLKKNNYKIVGLETGPSSTDIAKAKNSGDIALVVGNEVSGISDEVLDICDELIKIPMSGVKESLNVSVAFGIAAYTLLNN